MILIHHWFILGVLNNDYKEPFYKMIKHSNVDLRYEALISIAICGDGDWLSLSKV